MGGLYIVWKIFYVYMEKLVISLYFKLKGCVIDLGIIIMSKFMKRRKSKKKNLFPLLNSIVRF